MARIHIDNDDSLPDLADLLKVIKQSPRKKIQPKARQASDSRQVDTSNAPKPTARRIVSDNGEDEKVTRPRQRVLKKVENNARLASASKERVRTPIIEDNVEKKPLPGRTPRWIARPRVQELELSDDEDVENEVTKKEYDSDASLPSPSKLFRRPRLSAPKTGSKTAPTLKLGKIIIPSLPSVATPKEKLVIEETQPVLLSTSRPTSSSDNDKSAFLI